MKLFRFGPIVAMASLALMSVPASAADISTREIVSDGRRVVVASIAEEIVLGDERRFAEAMKDAGEALVYLSSNGGNLYASVMIGLHIRDRGFSTVVLPGSQCSSGCALAWLGGVERYMGEDSRIGFHRPYQTADKAKERDPRSEAFVIAYIERLGLPSGVVDLALAAPPTGFRWLTMADTEVLGIKLAGTPPRNYRFGIRQQARQAPTGVGLRRPQPLQN